MSQEMPDGDFKWLSQAECSNIEVRLNYANGRIEMFHIGLFDHQVNKEDEKSFIIEVDLEYSSALQKCNKDYPLAPVITIQLEITGKKQHNLSAKYLGAAFPYSRKLICLFLPTKHYVELDQLLRL